MGYNDYRTRNALLNKQSIGIELDAWGPITKKNDNYYNAYGTLIKNEVGVIEKKWRGYEYYQKYSHEQLETLSKLLPILMDKHNIDDYGIKNGNLEISKDALDGKSGIFSHTSYRKDKSDIYPDKDLIKLLNNLK